MICLLPTPALWRLAAAVPSPNASTPRARGANDRVLARLARRHKRQHPPQCHVSCREAATPCPRRAAALPSSSSQACPRRPRISAEPMKHPIPIGRTICRVIRRPSSASSAPSALRSPAPGLVIGAYNRLGSIPWKPSRSWSTIQALFFVPGMWTPHGRARITRVRAMPDRSYRVVTGSSPKGAKIDVTVPS